MVSLSPSYGSVLGGTGVLVSAGAGSQLMLKEDDVITCTFDGINVTGIYVNVQQAFCVSPSLTNTGRLLFQITVDGKFSAESKFTSCEELVL